MENFLIKHGNGFWLHIAGAAAIMALGWWFGYPLIALIFNTLFWPLRELWQKIGFGHPLADFFRFHVFLEGGLPVIVSFLIYALSLII